MERKKYALMTLGGAIGVIAAFLQTLEKLELIKNKDAVLPCNFNSVFSCSTVLNAWQSSVFGFPNSIMCMALFVIFTTVAAVGWGGGVLPRKVRFAIQGLTLFTLLFALWFLWQSTYVIGALCIFCIFCFAGLMLVNAMWLRLNAADMPKSWQPALQKFIGKQYDYVAWAGLGVLVAALMFARFGF